jgi:hypothetical protein
MSRSTDELGKTATESYQLKQVAFIDTSLSRIRDLEMFPRFKEGQLFMVLTSVLDALQSPEMINR